MDLQITDIPADGNNVAGAIIGDGKSGTLTCITCRMLFQTPKDQREHYKTELHLFNLKRKVANLPPVTEKTFDLKVKAVKANKEADEVAAEQDYKCETCNKTFGSANTLNTHLKSKKHLEEVKEAANRPEKKVTEKKERKAPVAMDTEIEIDNADGTLSQEEIELIKEKLKNARKLDLEDCLFCSHRSSSFENNMEHMTKEHGFFIPDIEYLSDLAGLIRYLGEKIGIGNVCMYCNGKGRAFHSLEGVQHHMTSLSHCKFPEEFEEEIAEFYDFSSEYEDTNIESKVQVSDDGLQISFSNGKVVGHRTMALYFRQRFKLPETRESVLVNSLLAKYRALEWHTKAESNAEHFFPHTRAVQRFDMKIGTKRNNQKFHNSQNSIIA